MTMTKILLVEDNEMNRDMLGRRLQRRGFEVVYAEDGEQALAQARAENPDIILMDLSLPVMDGWEATRRLKNDSEQADVPIVALTAHAMAQDEQKALDAGCDAFETKPVDFSSLLETIEGLVE
jgi:CheY-like chemotaxis protein